MNAVEIEKVISTLADQPFDAVEFPFAFLQAFGNKDDDQTATCGRFQQVRSRPCPSDQQYGYCCLPTGRVHEDHRHIKSEPGDRQGQGPLHFRHGRHGL